MLSIKNDRLDLLPTNICVAKSENTINLDFTCLGTSICCGSWFFW